MVVRQRLTIVLGDSVDTCIFSLVCFRHSWLQFRRGLGAFCGPRVFLSSLSFANFRFVCSSLGCRLVLVSSSHKQHETLLSAVRSLFGLRSCHGEIGQCRLSAGPYPSPPERERERKKDTTGRFAGALICGAHSARACPSSSSSTSFLFAVFHYPRPAFAYGYKAGAEGIEWGRGRTKYVPEKNCSLLDLTC